MDERLKKTAVHHGRCRQGCMGLCKEAERRLLFVIGEKRINHRAFAVVCQGGASQFYVRFPEVLQSAGCVAPLQHGGRRIQSKVHIVAAEPDFPPLRAAMPFALRGQRLCLYSSPRRHGERAGIRRSQRIIKLFPSGMVEEPSCFLCLNPAKEPHDLQAPCG